MPNNIGGLDFVRPPMLEMRKKGETKDYKDSLEYFNKNSEESGKHYIHRINDNNNLSFLPAPDVIDSQTLIVGTTFSGVFKIIFSLSL